MFVTAPIVIVALILLALVSMVVVPGAALIALPIALLLGIAMAASALRGVSARGASGGVERDDASAGERLPEPLDGPGEGAPRESSDRVTQG